MKVKIFGLQEPKIFSIVGDREVQSFPQLYKMNLLTYQHSDYGLGALTNHHNLVPIALKAKNNFFNCPFYFHLFSCREYMESNRNKLNTFKSKFITIEKILDANSFAFFKTKQK